MSAKSLFVAASALAGAVYASPFALPRGEAAVPTVDIPLGFNLKITTQLTAPGSNKPVEVVFDTGSENFWVFGPDSISNWGCTGLLCPGPCNASVPDYYDWPASSTASKPVPFQTFYAYGAYTKYVKGTVSVNDTFTFAGDTGISNKVDNVRVAVENYMSSRIGTRADGSCGTVGGYDLGILGTAPFYRKADWNTTGPSVRQDLLERGAIKAPVQSMWFDEPPAAWDGKFSGHAVFGGVETSKFKGPLVKVPVLENDGLGASVGYFVAQPNVSVAGVQVPRGELTTTVCHLDSGTTTDDLPVDDAEWVKAIGLVKNKGGFTVWPGTCDSIPLNRTFELTFPALPGQGRDSVTISVPLRNYARPGASDTLGADECSMRISTGGCMLSAGFSAAAFFAADDAANEIALAQGGVSKPGSLPEPAAMSLTIA